METYTKQTKWRDHVMRKAERLHAAHDAEAAKECTFVPKLFRRHSSFTAESVPPPSGLDVHVTRQRRAIVSREALGRYFERHESKVPPTVTPLVSSYGSFRRANTSSDFSVSGYGSPQSQRAQVAGDRPPLSSPPPSAPSSAGTKRRASVPALRQQWHSPQPLSRAPPSNRHALSPSHAAPHAHASLSTPPSSRRILSGRSSRRRSSRQGSPQVSSPRESTLSPTKAPRSILQELTFQTDLLDAIATMLSTRGPGSSCAPGACVYTECVSLLARVHRQQERVVACVMGVAPPSPDNVLGSSLISVPEHTGAAAYSAALHTHMESVGRSPSAARVQSTSVQTQPPTPTPPPAASAPVAASPPPAALVFEPPTVPPAPTRRTLGGDEWPFVGGLLGAWLAMKATDSPTIVDAQWCTAWCVIDSDGVLRCYRQGDSKGWFPFRRMEFVSAPAPPSSASVASSQCDVEPITLQSGTHIVQLAASCDSERQQWVQLIQAAIDRSKWTGEGEAPAEVVETDGILSKRFFSPGRRGKWLTRLVKVDPDRLCLEYFEVTCVAEVPLHSAIALAMEGGDDDELFLFKVQATGVSNAEVVLGDTSAATRDVWLRGLADVSAWASASLPLWEQQSKRVQQQQVQEHRSRTPSVSSVPVVVLSKRRPSLATQGGEEPDFISPTATAASAVAPSRPSIPVWSAFKTRQSKATLQLIGLDALADSGAPAELGFTAQETRLADVAALKVVEDFVRAHGAELLTEGLRRLRTLGATVDGDVAATVLTRPCWKYALYRVGTGYSNVLSEGGGQGLGIAELSSAFAALDAVVVTDEQPLSVDDVLSHLARQRSSLLSLASSAVLEGKPV